MQQFAVTNLPDLMSSQLQITSDI